jgi:hypothetical protein
MSGAKRLLEEHETRFDTAIQIALAAKVLQRCEFHGEILEGPAEITDAYRLGNARFSRGQFAEVFRSPREMTEAIKSAVEDYVSDECPRCAKFRYED